jgi:hypothetical protein
MEGVAVKNNEITEMLADALSVTLSLVERNNVENADLVIEAADAALKAYWDSEK